MLRCPVLYGRLHCNEREDLKSRFSKGRFSFRALCILQYSACATLVPTKISACLQLLVGSIDLLGRLLLWYESHFQVHTVLGQSSFFYPTSIPFPPPPFPLPPSPFPLPPSPFPHHLSRFGPSPKAELHTGTKSRLIGRSKQDRQYRLRECKPSRLRFNSGKRDHVGGGATDDQAPDWPATPSFRITSEEKATGR